MIHVNNIHKSYGTKSVLNNVSASFPAGQLTSLIGPNGAGKTTLLMMIGRLLKVDSGEIFINEQNITDIRISMFAKQVATLRQSQDFTMRLTVEELVAFGRFPYSRGSLTKEDHQAIDNAISFLSLEPLRQSYIDELSGGQRQMAFLAMTIAQETDYLLLDEPLNNLDMKHAVEIMRALRRLCDEQNRTVILVIHDINFAANYSNHIVAMKSGNVYDSGSVKNIVTEENLKALYEIEFEILQSKHGIVCNYFHPQEEF
ncbi:MULTISPECIES: iron ABC transporter ATP-binding protein [Marinomonas]|uniref:iron ABC transporter ATP-binding protein n=1 Tax=Marinomonas TaxID=28253 RepID=UPI0007AFD5D1|nr:ATP-binding cassette domain-containing protein [Marinomonas sp. TW1]KZN15020.1 iron ABC transporter ATP-binding protein [Marinomonas sp. TW1]